MRAENFGEYVVPGEAPPMTQSKSELIKDSRNESSAELADLCEAIVNDNVEVVLAMKDIVAWLKVKLGNRLFDSDYELRKTAVESGFKVFEKRIKVGGTMQYVLMSPAFMERWPDVVNGTADFKTSTDRLRTACKSPGSLMQDDM